MPQLPAHRSNSDGAEWGFAERSCRCSWPPLFGDDRHIHQTGSALTPGCCSAMERRQRMNRTELQDRLTAYLNIRKALGTSVGTHSRVLDNFVEFAGDQETTGS